MLWLFRPPQSVATAANCGNMKDKAKVTEFQSRVYELISGIPPGRVSTYGDVAKALSSCARAVGGALRRNPFAPVVPCHRVVMGDLSIGGFGGSFGDCANTRRKRKMLEDEGVRFANDKVAGNDYVHAFQCTLENTSRREAKRPLNSDRQGRERIKDKRAKKSS